MYNRYIRNDRGVYTRVPVEDEPPRQPPPDGEAPHEPPPDGGPKENEGARLLGYALEKLRDVDTADLLLLLLLFLLYEEHADDEALIALALLLIL